MAFFTGPSLALVPVSMVLASTGLPPSMVR
jgi:hypothetical protein